MTVKELTKKCYDTIIIYINADDECTEFKDLFKGKKEDIPKDLLDRDVNCFGAKKEGVIEIAIQN